MDNWLPVEMHPLSFFDPKGSIQLNELLMELPSLKF